MFCDTCGAQLEAGSTFCNSCGTLINGNKSEVAKESSGRIITTPSHHKKFIFVVVGVAIVSGICFIAFAYFNGTTGPGLNISNQSAPANQVDATNTTALTLGSIDPSIVVGPYQNVIALSGTGFNSSTIIKAGAVNLEISGEVSPNLIYVKYPGNFNAGTYNITVQNIDGEKFVLSNVLRVQATTPVPIASTRATDQTSATELSASQIVSGVSPSVVLIRTDSGCGSGMIVKSNGTILTDDHVISGAAYINVYLKSGAIYAASVINENTLDDLALIKINNNGLPTVTFGDSSDASLALGSTVTALGYPLTCNVDQTLEVDQGIVTARRTSSQLGTDVIQTSARINPGDSGGPLVDNYGNVVGINESIFTVEDLDLNVTGIAFATPSEVIEPFLNGTSYSSTSQVITNTDTSSALQTPTTNPRYFQFPIVGTCDDNGNGTVILSGYPLVNGYEIPPDDIDAWANGEISFTVPNSISAGTYQVNFRGYEYNPTPGFVDCSGGGKITIQ